jgi:hypothetical protein
VTISRDDLEAKALELVAAVDDTRRSTQDKAILIAVMIGVVVISAFVIGRKRGRRNKTVVEVYRV